MGAWVDDVLKIDLEMTHVVHIVSMKNVVMILEIVKEFLIFFLLAKGIRNKYCDETYNTEAFEFDTK
eukprot:snap_masked-scaffold_47-processed-gene-1.73-mRNA-1 protein AED:1.00 eAED:1.00 QI:0/0/0/0/1/1/2/0/66